VEWVETTGQTLEDATELALDQLGVDEEDAEIEVLEEPRVGLFGRTRGEARVRARVKPSVPRQKTERRDRRRPKEGNGRPEAKGRTRSSAEEPVEASTAETEPTAVPPPAAAPAQPVSAAVDPEDVGDDRQRRPRRGRTGRKAAPNGSPQESYTETNHMGDDANVEEQAVMIGEFLKGLVDAFGYEASLVEERVDDETIELRVDGKDLGLLIGPKGQTLQAVQELSRTVVQRQASGTHHGRVRLDIGGYRQRRREALERFTHQVAEDVMASGVAKVLEPMQPADRKVVHDVINDIDGVSTYSEGEDSQRRVVVRPAGS
jgi:spoIIIJ-associated protein